MLCQNTFLGLISIKKRIIRILFGKMCRRFLSVGSREYVLLINLVFIYIY